MMNIVISIKKMCMFQKETLINNIFSLDLIYKKLKKRSGSNKEQERIYE